VSQKARAKNRRGSAADLTDTQVKAAIALAATGAQAPLPRIPLATECCDAEYALPHRVCLTVKLSGGRRPTAAAIVSLTASAHTAARGYNAAVQSAAAPGYAWRRPDNIPSVFSEPTVRAQSARVRGSLLFVLQ
jgi:hypothetical protein